MTIQPRFAKQCAHELIEEQAQQSPLSVALTHEGRELTYKELDLQSNIVAQYLRERQVGPEVFVGVCAASSIEAIIILLGVLKAGAAFVPLDPSYPKDRLEYLIHHTQLSIVLSAPQFSDLLSGSAAEVLNFDSVLFKDAWSGFARVDSGATLENASCVLYTSGSSGRPKGVVRLHRAIVDRLAWTTFRPDDVFCHNMSFSVGFSQERLFLPLMRGLTLSIIDEDKRKDADQFVGELEASGVTTVTLVPEMLRQLLNLGPAIGSRLSRLHTVAVGGSTLSPDLIKLFPSVFPGAELVNAYGSTESGSVIRGTMNCSTPSNIVYLGRPVGTAHIHILGANMEPLADGVVGELYVDAPCLARGYLHDPELTRQRFIPNPFDGNGASRLYRTGDLARFSSNGEIEFIGRADRQVKIRGFRIELGEIESALQGYPHVLEATVTVDGREGAPRLVAYVVKKPGMNISIRELRGDMAKLLPDYMVPALFVFLQQLPKSSAGKVEQSALPAPSNVRPELDVQYQGPSKATEKLLVEIWSQLLHLNKVGLFDDFFELGGDSLSVAQMLFHVSETFHVKISGEQVWKHPTVAALASLIDLISCDKTANSEQAIICIPREGKLPLSISQEFSLMRQLHCDIRAVNHARPLTGFGLLFFGNLNINAFEDAIDATIARHEVLRTAFIPSAFVGPMKLKGWDSIKTLLATSAIRPTITFEPRIRSAATLDMNTVDFEHLSSEDRHTESGRLTEEIVQTPHDYGVAPLMRATLVRIGPREHHFILGVSHLIFDGLSVQIFQSELTAAYAAFVEKKRSPLPDLPIQFIDYANWERQRLQKGVLEELVDYWDRSSQEFPRLGASELPFAREITGTHTGAGKVMSQEIPEELCVRLRSFLSYNRTTLYTMLMVAVSVLLHIHTRRERVSIGAYFANRVHSDVNCLIGDFATFHVIGVQVPADRRLGELIQDVQHVIAEASAHQSIPHALLSSVLSRKSNPNGLPPESEPPITCELLTDSGPDMLPGLTIHRAGLLDRLSRFPMPLRIMCNELRSGPITMRAAYHTQRFDDAAIRAMLATLIDILAQVSASPDICVSSLVSLTSVNRSLTLQ